MALKTCPDCGTEISTKAVLCPQCGRPIQYGSPWLAVMLFVIFAVVVLAGGFVLFVGF